MDDKEGGRGGKIEWHRSQGERGGGKRDYFILYQMDDEDMLKDFKEFYEDVFPEFEKFGEVIQFKV